MKKLLSIAIFFLLSVFLTNSEATVYCNDKIEMNWNVYERKDYARFTITSSCEHPIYMWYVNVKTKDKKEIKRKNLEDYYIRPYGVETFDLYIGDLNQNIIELGSYNYATYKRNKKPKDTNISNNSKKNSSTGDDSNLFGLLIAFLVVGGIAMMISKNSSKTRSRSTPKTYTENYKETYSETDNSGSSEIMPKPEIQRRYKIIANFYNNYKLIDYGKIKNKKVAQKQMEDIVNVVDKNLSEISAGTANTPYRILIVGMVTFKLLSANQIKKVHQDLGKMYELGQRLQFDDRLMNALRNILDDNAGVDY